uniref:Tudor domain-containing protein n=1 Tax=viral metagenome TaxID=1070528 RepID=A0A6C0H571_9ZZZZ
MLSFQQQSAIQFNNVYNGTSDKEFEQPNLFYKCKTCNNNLSSSSPASQYQRLKLIQNTVRIPSSLFTMNLASLNVYQPPSIYNYNVNWKQMSDRKEPHYETPVASSYGTSTRGTRTRLRPGACTPGGLGVDIKHNSYNRYLNRIKGKSPLKRGIIPPNFGTPYPFNPAFPIYGGKTTKTAIIDKCHCGNSPILFNNPDNYNVKYTFGIGQIVLTQKSDNLYYKARIISINNGLFTVQFDDGTTLQKTQNDLYIFYDNSFTASNKVGLTFNNFIDQGDNYLTSTLSLLQKNGELIYN